jgi:hypothetical protein
MRCQWTSESDPWAVSRIEGRPLRHKHVHEPEARVMLRPAIRLLAHLDGVAGEQHRAGGHHLLGVVGAAAQDDRALGGARGTNRVTTLWLIAEWH